MNLKICRRTLPSQPMASTSTPARWPKCTCLSRRVLIRVSLNLGVSGLLVRASRRASLRWETNPRTRADLLVAKAIRWTIELANVETLRRCRSHRTSADDNAVSGLQGLLCHTDLHELRQVVHFQFPAFTVHVYSDDRLR